MKVNQLNQLQSIYGNTPLTMFVNTDDEKELAHTLTQGEGFKNPTIHPIIHEASGIIMPKIALLNSTFRKYGSLITVTSIKDFNIIFPTHTRTHADNVNTTTFFDVYYGIFLIDNSITKSSRILLRPTNFNTLEYTYVNPKCFFTFGNTNIFSYIIDTNIFK